MEALENFIIHKLVQEVIFNNNNLDFSSTYKKLKPKEKERFHETILENKLSSNFIKYIKNKECSNRICKSFYEKCRLQASRFQIHSFQVIKEIHEINSLFINEGLTPIYLKGIALQKEYDDISLRPMVDVDILFKKEELLRAYEILHKKNFLSSDEKQYLNKNNINHFCKRFYHIHIVTKNNISIELHYRVTRNNDFINCPISQSFFNDFQSIDYYYEKINIPSIENIIIHALCHFSINTSFKKLLRTLVDIKSISANHKIQWQEIILKYDDIKIRKGISLALELISLNQGTIQNLDRTRLMLKEYFPEEKLVQEAQHKLYDVSRTISAESFSDRLKDPKNLKALPGILFPSKKLLMYRYKILKPDYKSYIRYYKDQLSKIPLVLNSKQKSGSDSHLNPLNSWLNKN
ncbi:MAG: hypothetical protein CMC94_03815 [Flavobacteriales bacterium]|nr:hypothetical protein [Flavobacteriales bacterium]